MNFKLIVALCVLSIANEPCKCSPLNYDSADGAHPNLAWHLKRQKRQVTPAYLDWMQIGRDELDASMDVKRISGKAKNVIIFIGDGMGMGTETAATFLKAERDGTHPSATQLSWHRLPHVGLSRTYGTNAMTPESAETATAIMTGQKTGMRVIGVDQYTIFGDCNSMQEENKLKTILEYSNEANKWTGVVSTTRLTHATPASTYAKTPERDWEYDAIIPPEARGRCKDIARQLIEDRGYIRVLLSGGRQYFQDVNTTDAEYPSIRGLRTDRRDLLKTWQNMRAASVPADRYKYVMNQEQFDRVDPDNTDYLLGVFEPGYMCFNEDRIDNSCNEPSLKEMTEKAIRMLRRSPEGYFLLVEGGRIDHGHHFGMAYYALTDALALSEAVQAALDMTDEKETLLIVTADHSHTFSMGGYGSISRSVFDVTDFEIGDDGKPYTILAYANGPGFYYHRTINNSLDNIIPRINLTGVNTGAKTFLQDSAVPLFYESHAGEEVGIYARGPYAHLFHRRHEQNFIGHVMMYASCTGPYFDVSRCRDVMSSGISTAIMGYTIYVVMLVMALQSIIVCG